MFLCAFKAHCSNRFLIAEDLDLFFLLHWFDILMYHLEHKGLHLLFLWLEEPPQLAL